MVAGEGLTLSSGSAIHFTTPTMGLSAEDIQLNNPTIPATNVNDALENLTTRVDMMNVSSGVVDYSRPASAIGNLQMQGYASHELEETLRILMDMNRNANLIALEPIVNSMRALHGTI